MRYTHDKYIKEVREECVQEQRHGGSRTSRGESAGASSRNEVNCQRLRTKAYNKTDN